MGAELYKHLTQYFAKHLEDVRRVSHNCAVVALLCSPTDSLTSVAGDQAAEELQDEPLLKYYTDEWSRYTQGASFVTRLFAYLNRRECFKLTTSPASDFEIYLDFVR